MLCMSARTWFRPHMNAIALQPKRADNAERDVNAVDHAVAGSNQRYRWFKWVNEERQTRCKTEMRQQRQE